MATTFFIPRQTDREIITALSRIRASFTARTLAVFVHIDHQGWVGLPNDAPENAEQIQFALRLNSVVFRHFRIQTEGGNEVCAVVRDLAASTDKVVISDQWLGEFPEPQTRSEVDAKISASAYGELKASDLDSSLRGTSDNEWNRYREAQMAVVNSLQQASETLLIKAADRNTELDRARNEKFESLERQLRDEIANERTKLQAEMDAKDNALTERAKGLDERESAFNTKEARYVARKNQQDQIDQIKSWMEGWSLTPGTTKKRTAIFWAYIWALVLTGGLTAFSTYHNFRMIDMVNDLAALVWWQWVALVAKSVVPLAAFMTFMVYFIRWSASWARQHADEEFTNRTRLIDIGRSAWLLEAVRDAQERDKEIPAELLKELSRNLFSQTAKAEEDVHPQAAAELLLQGLSSLRIKAADGTEVEAKKGK